MKKENIAFDQGYICVVAQIINTHGEETIAKDVLSAAGIIDWSTIDALDRNSIFSAGLITEDQKNGKGN